MMILHLIKKDILLARKYVIIVMLVAFIIPLLFLVVDRRSETSISAFIPFLYMVVLTQIVLLQNVSHLESKNPKAPALLCASPYTRKTLVQAKYAFFALLFVYCFIAHSLVSLIVDVSKLLDLTSVLAVLLISVALYGVYVPVEFKYGVIKTKFIFTITILLISLGPVLFAELLPNIIALDFSVFSAIPTAILNTLLAVLSMALFLVSITVSMKIYAKKEL